MKPARSRAAFPLFFLISILIVILPDVVYADELIALTDKDSYSIAATVKVNGYLTKWDGSLFPEGLVAVQVEDGIGSLRLIRVLPTGTPPLPWQFRIVEFFSCDSQGNPKGSFNSGSLAYFQVKIESLNTVIERDVTIALNLFDSVGVSIAVAFTTYYAVPPGNRLFTCLISMPIPNDAFEGVAIGCVSVLTKWPKYGGYPYCPEEFIEFTINGDGSQAKGSSAASATGSDGSFYLSFKLPSNAKLGMYTVFARARYNAEACATFDYFWLHTDVNRDGRVNILDISASAIAFGSRIGDLNYNSLADINEDNIINILDIAAIALDYGKART